MSDFMIDDAGSEIATPVEDKNTQTPAAEATGSANPPIPEDHKQQTPEFLKKLILELNTLRQESSELFAKMYPMSNMGGPPVRPPYELHEEYRRQDAELDKKIYALRNQITDLHVLLSKPEAPKPELSKSQAPKAPAPSEGADKSSV